MASICLAGALSIGMGHWRATSDERAAMFSLSTIRAIYRESLWADSCRFTLIAETGQVRHLRACTGDPPFFAASKLGLEAHFCTPEMGLIGGRSTVA